MKYAGSWELSIRRIDNSFVISSFSIGVNFFHRDEKLFHYDGNPFHHGEKRVTCIFITFVSLIV